jgi:hypothetical protein
MNLEIGREESNVVGETLITFGRDVGGDCMGVWATLLNFKWVFFIFI